MAGYFLDRPPMSYYSLTFRKFFSFSLIPEKGEGKGKNINWLYLACTPNRDLTYNPGMSSDWELKPWPFCLRDDSQPNKLHQPGLFFNFLFTSLHHKAYRLEMSLPQHWAQLPAYVYDKSFSETELWMWILAPLLAASKWNYLTTTTPHSWIEHPKWWTPWVQ